MEHLIEVAQEVGLEIIENASLPESMTGAFIRANGDSTANLSKNIMGRPMLEKEVIATCIGSHIAIPDAEAYVPTYYDDYKKRFTANRTEYKRRRIAGEVMISSDQLLDVLASGLEEIWELAEHFGVREHLMAFRMAIWEKSGR